MQFMKTQAIFLYVCFENAKKYSLGLTTLISIYQTHNYYIQPKMGGTKKNKNTNYKKQ